MDNHDSNKRLKSSSGAPIKTHTSPAANLAAYTPPPAIGARAGNRPGSTRPSASIARPANGKTSLRLTVKAPPSKLRQATSGSQVGAPIPPNPYADNPSESDATPVPVAPRTARSTRNPRTVVEPESEEEEEDGGEDAEGEEPDEEEAEDVDQELLAHEDSEEDAEGDEDEEMDDAEDEHPPPPIITQERPIGKTKPNVTVTAPQEGPLQSVEDKEMEDDDEELSELDSNENENDEDDEEEDSDSDDDDNSRSATPDLSKLTRRQRGLYEEAASGLMSLSNEAQKKKHLTAEEHAMRRAEMARRRKNLSEKRNEEEKMDTINKLLKKPAPKRRTRAEIIAAQQAGSMATPGAEDYEYEHPDPLFVRWVNGREGSRIGVPEEWMEAPIGDMFKVGGSGGGGGRRMVEEVA